MSDPTPSDSVIADLYERDICGLRAKIEQLEAMVPIEIAKGTFALANELVQAKARIARLEAERDDWKGVADDLRKFNDAKDARIGRLVADLSNLNNEIDAYWNGNRTDAQIKRITSR